MSIYVSDPLPIPAPRDGVDFGRADLLFYGVEHSGPSYEGRVFLNAPAADEGTPLDEDSSYAGSFYIFGHAQRCFGGPGHCAVPTQEELDPFDLRLPHHLTPYVLTVVITEPLKKVRDTDATELVVTVVPVVYDDPDPHKSDILAKEGTLEFERLALITYD